jgi:SAM-dependent methyltransferase
VEPNQDMREVAERTLSEFPNFHSVDRSAENTTLPEDIVDFITVAQAFHWFDPDNFKVECQRILKPDGKVILIWNSRIKTQKFVKENESICKKFCPSFTGFSGGLEFIDDVISRFYNNNFELKHFANDLFFDKSKFIGTGLSVSYALKETDNEYKNYISALENLFDKYAVDGILTVPNETVAYIGKV